VGGPTGPPAVLWGMARYTIIWEGLHILNGMDTRERNAGIWLLHLRPARRMAGRAGYWIWLLVVLVVDAVTHRRARPRPRTWPSSTMPNRQQRRPGSCRGPALAFVELGSADRDELVGAGAGHAGQASDRHKVTA
jgi:hypothetical protein